MACSAAAEPGQSAGLEGARRPASGLRRPFDEVRLLAASD